MCVARQTIPRKKLRIVDAGRRSRVSHRCLMDGVKCGMKPQKALGTTERLGKWKGRGQCGDSSAKRNDMGRKRDEDGRGPALPLSVCYRQHKPIAVEATFNSIQTSENAGGAALFPPPIYMYV